MRDREIPSAPLLSIVTPCLNRAPLIGQAVESVQRQDYPRVEHIVMDGGSTDGTLEVLRRYPHLDVTSEKDRGLYDALNKAIQRARGEIVGHINSDDLYEPRVFGAVMRAFAAHPEADAVVGGAAAFEDTPSGPAVRQTFPPLAVHMIGVGEETGRLDEMLTKVAESFEENVQNTVKRFVSLLEPLIILVMGAVVGFMVISMLLAIFSINEIPF